MLLQQTLRMPCSLGGMASTTCMVVTMLAARCPTSGAYAGVRSMLVKRSKGPVAA